MSTSELTLQTPPFPYSTFRETATLQHLAFSDSALSRWWTPPNVKRTINSAEEIHPDRLNRLIRDHAHRELDPTGYVVCAVINGQIVGCASWRPPKHLWRGESLGELLYRKGIEYKDGLENWLHPSWWVVSERYQVFKQKQEECMEVFLGPGEIDQMWYLKILCVHPAFQRRGVGAALLDWGLRHARERGEKVYLEASEFGAGLYLKKGFQIVGELKAGEHDEVVLPCMVWDPETAPSQKVVELQVGQVQKQA